MDEITKNILAAVADLHDVPEGAYNIRLNGGSGGRRSTDDIQIISKTDKPGIDIIFKAGIKNKSVHIPVVVSNTGLSDLVYNDFYVGENADVLIVAGCGIHNDGSEKAKHDGVHNFHVGKNARVRYVEKHYGTGEGTGGRELNPVTNVELAEGAYVEMEMVQINGVDNTVRTTGARVGKNAKLVITERIMTHGSQLAKTDFVADIYGEGAHVHISSRSVARDNSRQDFSSRLVGNADSYGRTECDAIIMDNAFVSATPTVTAAHPLAQLTHEASIGKIAGEQLMKLMSLGLTEKEAEEKIIEGFLK